MLFMRAAESCMCSMHLCVGEADVCGIFTFTCMQGFFEMELTYAHPGTIYLDLPKATVG